MWAYESILYQIYPLGMTGAPFANDGRLEHRILKVKDWIPHLKKLGIGAIYFSPLFDSDTHGYNTRDFRKLDPRWSPTKILRKSAMHSTPRESALSLTVFSTMWAEASAPLRM